MTIRFTQTLSTAREVYRRGRTYELPAAEAKHCIKQGVATEVAGSKPQSAPKAQTGAAK